VVGGACVRCFLENSVVFTCMYLDIPGLMTCNIQETKVKCILKGFYIMAVSCVCFLVP
jgi:hypothetical protein